MFIAMNRFKVLKGAEGDFEAKWLNRKVHMHKENGFVAFRLLKGPAAEGHTLYASHTVWRSEADFEAWTRSQSFRDAHQNAGSSKPLYDGHPKFEGFTALQSIEA